MKAETMLPLILVTMVLQTGVLWQQGSMLQRQNDLISKIATNRGKVRTTDADYIPGRRM